MSKQRMLIFMIITCMFLIIHAGINANAVEITNWQEYDLGDGEDLTVYSSDDFHVIKFELKIEAHSGGFDFISLDYNGPDGESSELLDEEVSIQSVDVIADSAVLSVSGGISGEYRVHEFATGIDGVVENLVETQGTVMAFLAILGIPLGLTLVFVLMKRIRLGRM